MNGSAAPRPHKRLGEGDHGKTLAAMVRAACPEVSWAKARELCRTGRVRVDGETVFDGAQRLATGSTVEVDQTAPRRACPVLDPTRIVFNDGGLVVVDKPAGLDVVSADARTQPDSLTNRLALTLRSPRAGATEPFPLYHLDKALTGLVAFATDRQARRTLARQFREQTPVRRFSVLVWGQATAGRIDRPLHTDSSGRLHVWRGEGQPPRQVRSATTFVRVEATLNGATLLVCESHGLRRDQLQLHLAFAGTPVVGERRYGVPALEPAQAQIAAQQSRPMIHAAFLALSHPRHNRLIHVTAPPPPTFTSTVAALRNAERRS
ncbi:MAG: hypothetical protein B7733_19585 [Myxococcales bacterium FL481]|nr:MAG: hypothetical protein B7733_19585 [Myxococcales bacterium FL481]